MADKNHAGYPSNSVTLVTNQIIKMLCFDATEPSNGNSDRRGYGNNRYIYSNLRQWLNSPAAAGQWYTAQHSADQTPDSSHVWSGYNAYSGLAGFLNAFTANERAALLFLSTPSARRATAKTETKSLFSYKLYNILHEFRRALIYNGSKNYPNHAK